MVDVTQEDTGWAESAAQHLCAPPDRSAAINLLASAFAAHRIAATSAKDKRIAELEAAVAPLLKVCLQLDANEDLPWQIDGSMLDAISEALEKKYPVIWTPEQVAMLEARQADTSQHPYTCGGDRSDDTHRQIAEEDCHRDTGLLYPTERGWKCPACDYRQFWAHETGGPDAARKALTP